MDVSQSHWKFIFALNAIPLKVRQVLVSRGAGNTVRTFQIILADRKQIAILTIGFVLEFTTGKSGLVGGIVPMFVWPFRQSGKF